jgi:hypothetical protein
MACKALIEKALEILVTRGVCRAQEVLGCSDEDIRAVERDAGQDLPESYRLFLTRMGRGAGRFYRGSDHFYPSIVGLTKDARELIAKDPAQIDLPTDAIVFSMHQGYQFLFMLASEGQDPPVYRYVQRKGRWERLYERFSEYMLSAVYDEW